MARSAPSHANAPSATTTRSRRSAAISRSRYGRQASRSGGVGLFPGGAQRFTAVMYEPSNRRPSSLETDVGWLASPVRYMVPTRKSPERSPVKIRPVRFPP